MKQRPINRREGVSHTCRDEGLAVQCRNGAQWRSGSNPATARQRNRLLKEQPTCAPWLGRRIAELNSAAIHSLGFEGAVSENSRRKSIPRRSFDTLLFAEPSQCWQQRSSAALPVPKAKGPLPDHKWQDTGRDDDEPEKNGIEKICYKHRKNCNN